MSGRVRLELHFDVAKAATEIGIERGLKAAADILLEQSNQQVPLDTGTLLRSGRAEAQGHSAVVSYDTPYAVRWHEEDANFQHGRKKKYLEDPANNGTVVEAMKNAIAAGIAGEL